MDVGIHVVLRDPAHIPAAFRRAVGAGFRRGQVTFAIHGLSAQTVRQAAVAARDCGFATDAVGCYINPLRPDDDALTGVSGADWRTVAENMGMLGGAERLVCWSGTLGRDLGEPTLLNSEEAAFQSLFIALSGLREQVRGLPVRLLIEPHTAHVLADPARCVRLARLFPGGEVQIVLDAPNLISPRTYPTQGARVPEMIALMGSAIGLVHLKDFAPGPDGQRRFLRPGAGVLDFGLHLRAIAQLLPEVPLVIEGTETGEETGEEMRAAGAFVRGLLPAPGGGGR